MLSTGSQGEPLSALARMAAHDHPSIEIMKGDTVIISARPVPGNETSVYRTIDRLFAAGARVIYESAAGVHVSGHASTEELKVMLNLVKPKFFMPVHGEHRHLYFHAELARAIGMPDENIFIMENGDVLELTEDEAVVTGKVQAGMILVDGFAMGDFHDLVLRDRQHLASDGLVMVVVARSAQDGKMVGEPEVVFRGIAHAGGLEELAEKAEAAGDRLPVERRDAAGQRSGSRQEQGARRAAEVPAQGGRQTAHDPAGHRRGVGSWHARTKQRERRR